MSVHRGEEEGGGGVYTPTERRTATVCELRDRALIMARGGGGGATKQQGGQLKFYPYKRKGGRIFCSHAKGCGGGGGERL